mmetsp:Transcript_20820/g.31564  ORF Transcript_20820/g.31564 Transcript_20820/m.31564 type:complete len:103 (-) Transcript_20820:26-334(-)
MAKFHPPTAATPTTATSTQKGENDVTIIAEAATIRTTLTRTARNERGEKNIAGNTTDADDTLAANPMENRMVVAAMTITRGRKARSIDIGLALAIGEERNRT